MFGNQKYKSEITPPTTSATSIAATIFMCASPIRPVSSFIDVRYSIKKPPILIYTQNVQSYQNRAKQRLQKTQQRLRDLEQQQDSSAAHIRELENPASKDQYRKEIAAREHADARAFAVKAANSKLLETIDGLNNIVGDLQGENSKITETLKTLYEDHEAVTEALREKSCKFTELEVACETLKIDVMALSHENRDLQQEIDDLSSTAVLKDKQIQDTQEICNSVVADFSELKGITVEIEKLAQKQNAELTEQRAVYRTQSNLLAEKLKLLEQTKQDAHRLADIAQAETRNNHDNWIVVLENKNAEISGLDALVEAYKATDGQSVHLKHVMKTYQALRNKNAKLEKLNKAMKTDIQNLLDTKQSDSKLLTEYLYQAGALRAERTEALDQIADLDQKLEKSNKYIAKLQKIISDQAVAATAAATSCNGFCVPREVVNNIVAEAIADYYTEAEKLRQDLHEQELKTRDVQTKLDECDNKLFEGHIAEEDRLVEVSKLRTKVSALRQERVILTQQVKHRNSFISAIDAIDNDMVYEILALLRDDIEPLQEQNRKLITERYELLDEIDHYKEEMHLMTTNSKKEVDNLEKWYKGLEDCYWDIAVHEHDHLHRELAYWKKKCGKNHFCESRPSNLLVHDRRMLQAALQFGREGLERGILPKEYFDSSFLKGCHQAVDLALRKLWPDFYQYLHEYAAWVEPTVPLLTGAGEIVMDPATRAASNGRLEEFEMELKALDEQIEEARNRKFNIGSDEAYSTEEDEESSGSEKVATCSDSYSEETSGSSPPTSKSNTPEPEETDETWGDDDNEPEVDGQFSAAEDNDGMPAFVKNLRARISAREEENKYCAGYVVDHDVNQEAFFARYGHWWDGE